MVGLGRIVDMMTGLNTEILTNSRYYRWDIVFILLFSVLMVASNFYLIPRYGFNGAAAASLLSVAVYNLVKLVFIRQKLAIQPFTTNTLKVFLLGGAAYGATLFIPYPADPSLILTILDMLLRSVVVAAIFGGGILIWRVSEDISAGFTAALNCSSKGERNEY